MAGSKKTEMLRQVEGTCRDRGITLTLHPKPKKEDGTAQMQELAEVLKGSSEDSSSAPIIGTLPKDKPTGAMPELWNKTLADTGFTVVDVSSALGDIFAVKEDDEVTNVKKAAYLASQAMSFAVKQLEDIIDQEKKVKHSKLMAIVEEAIQNPAKLNIRLKPEAVDLAYSPLFQSGGDYDIKYWVNISNDDRIHYDVIMCCLGTRYSSYCANVGRTLLVNPNKKQEEEYAAIFAAQAAAINALTEGAKMSAAFEGAVAALKEKGQHHLVEKLPKNIGSIIGLELKDNTQNLSATNDKVVKAGMTFNVTVGVAGLERKDAGDGQAKTYALLLSDTVVVKPTGTPAEVVTLTTKDWKEIAYFLDAEDDEEDEDEDEDEAEDEEAADGGAAAAQRVAVRKSARTEQVDFKAREEERRRQKENQEELLTRVNEATLQMLTKTGGAGQSSAGVRKITDIVAYKAVNDVQHNNSLTVQVDLKNETVLVPIYGVLVPFHILTIKNATNSQDGEHSYIRINFNYTGNYDASAKYATAIFVKELSFRTSDTRHAAKVVQEIKMLRGNVQQRDKEKAERATLVQQEKLIRSKSRIYTLPDVWVRPAFGGKGRKVTGTLEAHANGFRYTSPKGEELDIMYRNIKHAFFQPAEKEMMTLLHFHLHNPIMVGKKKATDVQFYTEVMDAVQTLDAGRRSMYDPDEIEEEQRERERRNQTKRQFSAFVKKVQHDIWEREFGDLNLEFEMPFRELGFTGVPARSTCFIMPTVNCLVELTEMPFTVITLSEVNLVNLERVGFNLRNFDLVFIPKDLDRDVWRIDAIPSQHMDTIKDWLTSIEVKFYESKVNLNWKNIIKTIKDDPEGFIEDGGWNFLDDEGSDSEDGEEEESDFAPSEAEEVEVSEGESSEDESLVESGDDSEVSLDSDESEGLDWDELEEQALNDDKRKFQDGDEDEGRKGRSSKKARR
jgi:nucleosome binding factor SPN SPT16 subunit